MAVPMMTGNFTELTEEGLQEIYWDTLKKVPTLYTQCMNISPTNKLVETDLGMAGFSYWGVKPENTDIIYSDVIKGRTQNYTQVTRAGGFIITYEMKQHDLKNTYKQLPAEFAQAGLKTIDFVFSNILNRGVDSNYPGPDGKPYGATDHPCVRFPGITNSNLADPLMTLSRANLETALGEIGMWVNESGLPMLATPEILMVHPTKEMLAHEIIESPERPDTAERAKNVIPKLRILANPYFGNSATDREKWVIICNPQKTRQLKMFVARALGQMRLSKVERNYDNYYSDIMEWAMGFSHWRDVYFGYMA